MLRIVEDLNRRDNVDGILVQLPLPPQVDAKRILEAVDPAKDVDGFHPINAGRLATGGSGLGLSIVAAIAAAHGGELILSARPDGGLRVVTTLPLAAATELAGSPG